MTEGFYRFKTFNNYAANHTAQTLCPALFGAGGGNSLFRFYRMSRCLNIGVKFHIVADSAGMLCIAALGAGRFNNFININMLMSCVFPNRIKLYRRVIGKPVAGHKAHYTIILIC